jgi:pimeloyl-ACP methyl ester carboxylesterase
MSGIPGDSTDVTLADGRSLHYRTAGSGSPTVVLEAGMGSSLGGWASVVPGIADRTTAVAYDRSGYGRSDPDPRPRDVERLAADLVELLGRLDDDRFVLVGHSWGGPIIRQALAEQPDLIAGLVLVDPSDEDMELFDSPSASRSRRWMVSALPWMRRLGLVRMGVKASTKGLPPEVVAELAMTSSTAAHVAEFQAELRTFDDDITRLRADPLPTPDVPVTIITGVKRTRKLGPGTGDEARDAVLRANQRRAASFPQGRHVSAEHSTHYVPFTEPEIVVAETLALVDAARAEVPDPPTT